MTAHLDDLRRYYDQTMHLSVDKRWPNEEERQLLWSAIERTVNQAESGAYLVNSMAYEVRPVAGDHGAIRLQLVCTNGIQPDPLLSLSPEVTLAQILDAVRSHEHEYHPVPKEH